MRFSRRQMAVAAVGSLVTIAACPALAQSDEEAAVTRAVDALFNAMKAADPAQLEAITAPELSWGHSSGRIENRQEFLQSYVDRVMVPKTMELTDRRIVIVGDNAIVRHNFTAEAVNRAGQTVPVRVGMMQVWQKRGGNWVLLAHQAFPRPPQT
jgi:ketosteroid isomerase-like protein